MVVKRARLCLNVLLSVMFIIVLSGVVFGVPVVEEMKGVYQNVLYAQPCGLSQSFQVATYQSGVSELCYRGSNFKCDASTNGKRYKLVNFDAAGVLCSKDGTMYKWNVCASGSEKAKFQYTSSGLVLATSNQQVGVFTCKEGYSDYWVETSTLPKYDFSNIGNCGEFKNNEVVSTDTGSVLCSFGKKYICDSALIKKVESISGVSMLCSSSKKWIQCGQSGTFSGDGLLKENEGNVKDGFYCEGTKWVEEPSYELVGKPLEVKIQHVYTLAPLCYATGIVEVCGSSFSSGNGYYETGGSDSTPFFTSFTVQEISTGDMVLQFSQFGSGADGWITLCGDTKTGGIEMCDGIRDDVSLSSLWKGVVLPNGAFTLQHVRSGQFLCARGDTKFDSVGMCKYKIGDFIKGVWWDTSFKRVDEICDNEIDDDKDELTDCSDDMCYTHSACESLWKGKWNVEHLKSGQYLCGSSEGGVEMCEYAQRKATDPWQTEWNMVLKSKGVYNYFVVEDVSHTVDKGNLKNVPKLLCSANTKNVDTVSECFEEQELGISAPWRMLFVPVVVPVKASYTPPTRGGGREGSIDSRSTVGSVAVVKQKYEVRFEHVHSNEYLCGESVKKKYKVEKCGQQDWEDTQWSTRWMLNALMVEDCTNGKDDDGDGTTDCLDSGCANDVKCKVVCPNGVKCGGVPAKGLLDEVVCGTDFQHWKCGANGNWVGQGGSCKPCPFPEVLCADKLDNDGDGKADCKDSDCVASDECQAELCKGCMEDCLIKKDKAGVDKWTCVDCELDLQCTGGKKCIDYKCGFPVDVNAVTCVDSDVVGDVHMKGGVTLLQNGKVVSSEEDVCVAVDVLKELKCGSVQGKAVIDYDAKECAEKPEQEYCLNGACQKGLVLGIIGEGCDEKTICPEGSVCDVVKGKPELGKVCLGGEGGSCPNSNFCAPGFVCKNNKCVDVKKFPGEVICDDGIDNDKDGKIDCQDGDCDDELNGNGFFCCSDEQNNNGKKDLTPCPQGTMCDNEGLYGSYQCMECIPGEKECAKGSCVKGKCKVMDGVNCFNEMECGAGYVCVGVSSSYDEVNEEEVTVPGTCQQLSKGVCDQSCGTCGWKDVQGKCQNGAKKDGSWCCHRECSKTKNGVCDTVFGEGVNMCEYAEASKCVVKDLSLCGNVYETIGKKVGKDKSIVEKLVKLFTKGKYIGCLKGDFNIDGVIDADDSTDYVISFRKAVKEKVVDEKANLDESGDNIIDASDTTDYVLAFRNYGQLKK